MIMQGGFVAFRKNAGEEVVPVAIASMFTERACKGEDWECQK
jgi:hypothetical protein